MASPQLVYVVPESVDVMRLLQKGAFDLPDTKRVAVTPFVFTKTGQEGKAVLLILSPLGV